MRTAFVINPASSNGKTGKVWKQLQPLVTATFPNAEFHFTERSNHAQELARNLAESGVEYLIAVGGDGTFNEVVNGLMRDMKPVNPSLTLGTLPMGTGGDLVRTLCIPKDPRKALAILKTQRTIQADVGHVTLRNFAGQPTERYFFNLFSFGLSALTANIANSQSKALGGTLSFLKSVVQALFRFRSTAVAVKVGREEIFSGPISNVALGNGKFFGGGIKVAPQAEIDSGNFQVVVMPALPKRVMLCKFPMLYWGGHINDPTTISRFADSIEAFSPTNEEVLLEMDGETPGKLPITAKCIKNCIRLTVGPTYPATSRISAKP